MGRIGDKRILSLVKAFLRAGVLSEDGVSRATIAGTPQGGILSPLLADIALSVLDEHFVRKYAALGPAWTRAKHRRAGGPVMRLVRYADDFVVLVAGQRGDAAALWDEVGSVLAPMGLRLSVEKTGLCHIDEGFDFLGWRSLRFGLSYRDVEELLAERGVDVDHVSVSGGFSASPNAGRGRSAQWLEEA